MIVEYIRYKVPTDGDALKLLDAYQAAEKSLQVSPHCEAYEMSQCVDDPHCLVLRIEWDSADGHMQGFRKSPEFQSFFAAVKPFVGMIEEMRHYEVNGIRVRK